MNEAQVNSVNKHITENLLNRNVCLFHSPQLELLVCKNFTLITYSTEKYLINVNVMWKLFLF